MPPSRDEQEYESKRQQIIEGALHVFADKGFEAATNREIARASGIGSPGLIYHYFKDKADLLRQVVEERAPPLQFILHGDDMIELPPREAFMRFGTVFVKIADNKAGMAMLKMMLSEAARRPAVADLFSRIGPMRSLAFLRRYLEHHMELGNLRRMDPGAAARCFVGPLVAYIITREIFVMPDSQTLTPETMVESLVDVYLQGMEPR